MIPKQSTAATPTSGHVFVINGRIERLVHDAAIVPTARNGYMEKYWLPLYPKPKADPEPTSWDARGYAPSATTKSVWFIEVSETRHASFGADGLADRLTGLLRTMAVGLGAPEGRVLPLIAMPVLSVGAGGMNTRRGEVIIALLRAAMEFTRDHAIDVAIVTPSLPVYAAVQHLRRTQQALDPHGSNQADVESQRLAELAANGQLALLIGAGASVPSGLPSWSGLLSSLAKAKGEGTDLVDQVEALENSPLDQAELLAKHYGEGLADAIRAEIGEDARPSLAHALLAGLRVREVLTTNYDNLYEIAVEAADRAAPVVLPQQASATTGNWLLKMHGSLDKDKSIVLTRSDFVHFDARGKPAASVLQAVALTRHLLMVGISLNDDNVVRLLLEVQQFREKAGLKGSFATLLSVQRDDARTELWRDRVTWITMGEGVLNESARALEIFLDRVAMYAVRNSRWLLDDRFTGLLAGGKERKVAESVREVARQISSLSPNEGSAWRHLLDSLESFGVQPSKDQPG